jgi:hypothetical protein
MTSVRQLEANRLNALRSTGPRSDEGKGRSRLNAVRHGLTAETVVPNLEDPEDYKAFEATIIADYCAETAVARELVLRLASILWRLRRATAIETQLFGIKADTSLPRGEACQLKTNMESVEVVWPDVDFARTTHRLTDSFLRLASLDNAPFERLNRYEAALWRQAVQIIVALHPIRQR